MKKYLLAAAAVAVLSSSPAMALDWKNKSYGQDAVGWYDLKANVQSFCKFGTDNESGNLNFRTTVVPGAPGSTAEADGTFTFDIQDPDDNTVRLANGNYDINYAVCNSPFSMKVTSTNGGLKSDQTTSDTAFIQKVDYIVTFAFDGKIGLSTSAAAVSGNTVATSNEARAGSATVNVTVPPRDKLLLEGTYSDRLVAELVPNLG